MVMLSHTIRLRSAAHGLGDKYYESLYDLLCTRQGNREECERLAASYLAALRKLDKHLSTIDAFDDLSKLRGSTATYIDLVQKDLVRFAEPKFQASVS